MDPFDEVKSTLQQAAEAVRRCSQLTRQQRDDALALVDDVHDAVWSVDWVRERRERSLMTETVPRDEAERKMWEMHQRALHAEEDLRRVLLLAAELRDHYNRQIPPEKAIRRLIDAVDEAGL